MTLTQIIAKAAERYTTARTSANQGAAICDIQRQLFVKLGILKPQYETFVTTTIADQASYSLPSDCRIENVWGIQIEETSGGEYEDYQYAPFDQQNVYGNYYTRGASDDTFYLFKDGEAIPTAGLEIQIFYYPRPVNFDGSDLTVVPALDTDYHDYFWMKLIEDNASLGDYPDFVVAKAWRNEADLYFKDIKDSLSERLDAASPMMKQCKEYY